MLKRYVDLKTENEIIAEEHNERLVENAIEKK